MLVSFKNPNFKLQTNILHNKYNPKYKVHSPKTKVQSVNIKVSEVQKQCQAYYFEKINNILHKKNNFAL